MSATEIREAKTRPGAADSAVEPAGFGSWLVLWMALTVAIHGGLWLAGFRTSGLADAVEQGAARTESKAIGEVGDDLIRKAIRSQHDTLPFWTVVSLIDDFLVEPFALAVRAVAAATAFAAIAALGGRTAGYDKGLAECAAFQGFWVLGLAVRAALMVALRRTDVATSAALLLPPGTYHAAVGLAAGQLEAFALIGWVAMMIGAVRRGQTGWIGAACVCLAFGLFEAAVRVAFGLVIGAGMRLSFFG